MKLNKAKDLYLRGFNGEYIKRRTGISMQSLLKQLRAAGETFTKADIISYQVAYISGKYGVADVEAAYREIIRTYDDLDRARRGKHIICLGCGFGDYPKVFRKILGSGRYDELRNEEWHAKQVAAVRSAYGVDNVFEKAVFDQISDPGRIADGRRKRTDTMLARYGVREPNQNEEIKRRAVDGMRRTTEAKYGTAYVMKDPEIARVAMEKRHATMVERYGAGNSVQVPAIRDKIFNNRVKNGTVNSSKPEDMLYKMFVEHFGAAHVFRNVIVDERYPYHVDIYVDTLDLFVELNGDRAHYTRWYDPDSVRDRQVVEEWTKNMIRVESATGKKSRYRKYISTWTVSDPEKRNAARAAGLRYLVFWDGGNKGGVPTLKDAREWFAAGCPMPDQWRPENTYGIANGDKVTV